MHADMADGPDGFGAHHVAQPVVELLVEIRKPLEGVAAQVHRRGAGVVRLPGQGDLDQPDADDRGHHAHRLFRAVQVGALFDMRLDEAGEARGIQEVARHQIGHPCPALGIGSARQRPPAQTVDPVVTPKRPSSSWKLTTEIAGPPASFAARATSSAAITP
jgi:hypothetical protein